MSVGKRRGQPLKRLRDEDALADRDPIRAVVLGAAIHGDDSSDTDVFRGAAGFARPRTHTEVNATSNLASSDRAPVTAEPPRC
ncbi:MAG TPA: hypothetical protein VFT22_04100 [Kofleriaceae bacterium]|nr:hypothetical protein [Kofleriaceae bacterium]